MTVRMWTEHQVQCDGCGTLGPTSSDSMQAVLKLAESEGWVCDVYTANCPSCLVTTLDAPTFLDLMRSGEATPAMFDDAVDAWHDGTSELSLAAYLGMSESQYAYFLESDTALGAMLRFRVQ